MNLVRSPVGFEGATLAIEDKFLIRTWDVSACVTAFLPVGHDERSIDVSNRCVKRKEASNNCALTINALNASCQMSHVRVRRSFNLFVGLLLVTPPCSPGFVWSGACLRLLKITPTAMHELQEGTIMGAEVWSGSGSLCPR
jgi:hypothetical protein